MVLADTFVPYLRLSGLNRRLRMDVIRNFSYVDPNFLF